VNILFRRIRISNILTQHNEIMGGAVCAITSKCYPTQENAKEWEYIYYKIFGGVEFKETVKVAFGSTVSALSAHDGLP